MELGDIQKIGRGVSYLWYFIHAVAGGAGKVGYALIIGCFHTTGWIDLFRERKKWIWRSVCLFVC